jgi:hypothetical protein
MFIFFTCIKKTNQKKVQPVTWSVKGGLPEVYALLLRVLLAKNGRHRKVVKFIPPCGVLSRVAFPFLAVLLDCVRRREHLLDQCVDKTLSGSPFNTSVYSDGC